MNLKEIKVDLNTLFHFNFDSLKLILDLLYNNQNEMIIKINELDTKIKQPKVTIKEDQSNKSMRNSHQLLKQESIHFNEEKEKEKKKRDEIEEETIEIIETKKEYRDHNNYFISKDEKEKIIDENSIPNIDKTFFKNTDDSIFSSNNKDFKDLNKRVSVIEKNIKQLSYSKISQNQSEPIIISQEKIRQISDLDYLSKQIKETNNQLSVLTRNFEELSTKVNLNIHELLNECKTDGALDLSKVLIMNLEQKIFKKFSFIDEKNKQITDDQFKINKNLNDIKMKLEVNDISIDQLGKQFPILNDMINDINNNIDKVDYSINDKVDKQQKSCNEIGKKVEKMNESIEKIKGEIGQINSEPKNIESVNDLQMIKEIYKRINDLEWNFRGLGQSVNPELIKDDIKRLKADLNQKINNTALYEINDKINLQASVIVTLKDTNEKLIEDRNKITSDSILMMKKLESLNAAIISMKINEESNLLINKANVVDTSKYLELSLFNDFIKLNRKEQDKLIREDDDLRRTLNEISSILKTKGSDEDLKNIETCFNAKLEEMKLFTNKKCADKNETFKNIKYLDTQLKHIIEFYVKKNEKGDNWLLAKKPIGGFSCASCETYIGELPEKKDFLVWNKYPMRESQEKAYRVHN